MRVDKKNGPIRPVRWCRARRVIVSASPRIGAGNSSGTFKDGGNANPQRGAANVRTELEVPTAAPNEKPAPVVEQTPVPEELATPSATAGKKEPPIRESAVVRFKAPEPLPRQLRRHYRPRKLWQLALLFPIIRTSKARRYYWQRRLPHDHGYRERQRYPKICSAD
jgi:hypothetical protein